MAILRTQKGSKPELSFRVNLNIVVTGSKKMTEEEQQAAMPVDEIHVLIVDAESLEAWTGCEGGAGVLIDEVVHSREFKTGSVGYSLQTKATFEGS